MKAALETAETIEARAAELRAQLAAEASAAAEKAEAQAAAEAELRSLSEAQAAHAKATSHAYLHGQLDAARAAVHVEDDNIRTSIRTLVESLARRSAAKLRTETLREELNALDGSGGGVEADAKSILSEYAVASSNQFGHYERLSVPVSIPSGLRF